MASVDFRRENQAEWAKRERDRLVDTFGDLIAVELHVGATEFGRGERALTISDPDGVGLPVAVCFSERSDEGGFWRVDVLPIDDDSVDVPRTRTLLQVALEMRYGKCVFATWDAAVGRASGEAGWPDTADGVVKALRGGVRVQRRLSVTASSPSKPYARLGGRQLAAPQEAQTGA